MDYGNLYNILTLVFFRLAGHKTLSEDETELVYIVRSLHEGRGINKSFLGGLK